MIDRLEHFFRRWRRRVSRSEWAIRLLGLPASENTSADHGLLLIQVDGLSRRQMERAMKRGRLPFLRRLHEREHYDLSTFYPGLPATTPAVQAELHYGVRCAVPAFSFLDRESRRVATMFNPERAKAIESRLKKRGKGLLEGGSSWSNIYTGGAAEGEAHFCSTSLGLGDVMRSSTLRQILNFIVLQFPAVLRTVSLLVGEFFLALWDAARGLYYGERLADELKCLFARVFVCVGLREVVTAGAKIDLARGLPVIHVNFLGYDEQSHRRGPTSAFAHWSLRGIDRAIKNLYHCAHRSARRDYQVWIFSDHGQEATRSFARKFPGGLEHVIHKALEGFNRAAPVSPRTATAGSRAYWAGGRRTERRMVRRAEAERLTREEEESFVLAAQGPVGHLYLLHPDAATQKKRKLAERLVHEGSVPGVLFQEDNDVFWLHPDGEARLPDDAPAILPHPAPLRREVSRDLIALCRQENAGDLVLLGWSPRGPAWTFPNERGAHAGPGPEETQGFALLPDTTRLPQNAVEFIRPSDLRAAALNYLGRETIQHRKRSGIPRTLRRLRVMTYNIHGCRGMDGRISPKRIARVIERYSPDVIALQEVDFGRPRSNRHDQAGMIAAELGMHSQFCPTVISGTEHYGHALLSHHPLKVIRTEILSPGPGGDSYEPRGALWVLVEIDGIRLNLMNTHFGLRRRERNAQVKDLLSEGWIGSIKNEDPLILCGDFNMIPDSGPYRALTRRLHDVQIQIPDFRPIKTFSTLHPIGRIDHIFVSGHFGAKSVIVPRNLLTRVASDHLPLIVDLSYNGIVSTAVP